MKKLLFLFLSLIIVGCAKSFNGTSTGNPFVKFSVAGSGQVALLAKNIIDKLLLLTFPRSYALPPPSGMVDSANNPVTITDFWISIGNIEFKLNQTADVGEVDGSEIEFAGPFGINLLDPNPSFLISGNLIQGQFHRLKFKLTKVAALPNLAPNGLLNQSIYMAGTVNGKAFTFSSAVELENTISGPNLVTGIDNDKILLQIKTANIIKKINLSSIATAGTPINEGSLQPAVNPCPLINTAATDLYTCFYTGITSEANLGRDTNGDFELGTTEDKIK